MKKTWILFVLMQYVTFVLASSDKASWDKKTWQDKVNSSTDTTIQNIKNHVGMAAAEAVAIISDGVTKFASNKSLMQNKTYYNPDILTTNWLQSFNTWFNSSGRTNPFSNMVEVSYTDPLQVDTVSESYIKTHLQVAINAFKDGATVSTRNKYAYMNTNSSWNAQNYVVIHRINNNTQTTFYIFQKGKNIGALHPGVNVVALYGATLSEHASSDIVFIPSQNFAGGDYTKTHGQWRISYKKSLSGDLDSQEDGQNFSLEGPSKAYICAEVSTKDIPKGGVVTYQRAQCVDVSMLNNATFLEFTVEEELSDIVNNQLKTYDFDTLKMFYPSIRCAKQIPYVTIPYLLTSQTVMQDIHELKGFSNSQQLTTFAFNVGFNSGAVALSVTSQNLSILNQYLQDQGNISITAYTYPFQGVYHAQLEARVGSKILFTQVYDTIGVDSSAVPTNNNVTYSVSGVGSEIINIGATNTVVLKAAGYEAVAPKNKKVSSWIDLINIVLLCTSQNFAHYGTPSYIQDSLKKAQEIYFIQNTADAALKATITSPMEVTIGQNSYLNTASGNTKIQVATSKFPKSNTLPVSDIPTPKRFGFAMKLYTRNRVDNNQYVDMNSAQLTTTALLSFMQQTKFAEQYGYYKLLLPYTLKVKKIGTKGFTVVGSKGFAKAIVDELQKNPLIFITIRKLPGVYLQDQKGNKQHFTMNDFLRNIGTQAVGGAVSYMKPTKITAKDNANATAAAGSKVVTVK